MTISPTLFGGALAKLTRFPTGHLGGARLWGGETRYKRKDTVPSQLIRFAESDSTH